MNNSRGRPRGWEKAKNSGMQHVAFDLLPHDVTSGNAPNCPPMEINGTILWRGVDVARRGRR